MYKVIYLGMFKCITMGFGTVVITHIGKKNFKGFFINLRVKILNTSKPRL